MGAINWGDVITRGFDLVKDRLSKNSPPPSTGLAGTPVEKKFPVWGWVVIAGLLLFGKKIFKRR